MDNKAIKRMCHIAMFEQYDGREDIEICKSYRRDYIGIGILKNFILITIAYFIVVGLVLVLNYGSVSMLISDLNFMPLVWGFFIIYIIILGVYLVIIGTLRKLKYDKAQKRVSVYIRKLKQLEEILENSDSSGS